jgi:hypothetical protein
MDVDRVDVGGPAVDDVARYTVVTVDPAEIAFPGMIPGIVWLARAERDPGGCVAADTDAQRKTEPDGADADERDKGG